MGEEWLNILEARVREKSLVVFQFEGEEWCRLRESRLGVHEFTVARPREVMSEVQALTACLIFGTDGHRAEAHFGLVSSRLAVSTLDSRVKVRRALPIQPSSKTRLLRLVREQPHAGNLQRRLASDETVIVLSSKLSAHVVNKLAERKANHGPLRTVAASLSSPIHFRTMADVQEDAVQTALRAFGLSANDQASSLELVPGKKTALERVHIFEDAVIENDARSVPGYDLVGSDTTGYAVFEKDLERLEVYTANRRPLEHVFGVDLIYLNVTRQNIVMLQYKMLEPANRRGGGKAWIYRPDDRLESEMRRMRQFSTQHSPGQYEYRLNPQVFYLKFIKRDGALKNAAIITPLDHFERLRADPSCRGPRGGVRISFNSLAGRYLRQSAFLDLLRSGYIGAHAETTAHLKELVQAVMRGNKAVVAAVQSQSDDAATDLEEFDPTEVFD